MRANVINCPNNAALLQTKNDTHKATRILRDHEVWNDSFTYLANNKDLTGAKSDSAWIEIDLNWSWLSDPAKLRARFDWKIRKTFRAICTCVADGENWFEPTFSNIIIDSRKREKSHQVLSIERPIQHKNCKWKKTKIREKESN